MGSLLFDTMARLTPTLLSGDLETCEREVAKEMRKLPVTPFHVVLDISISNDPAHAAEHFDEFFRSESGRIKIAAAYTDDGGHNDYDWLSRWQTDGFEDYTVNGLDRLQAVYASEAFGEEANREAAKISNLMVVVKFQRFMDKAARLMKRLKFPLYVTAHDFDFIATVRPNG